MLNCYKHHCTVIHHYEFVEHEIGNYPFSADTIDFNFYQRIPN